MHHNFTPHMSKEEIELFSAYIPQKGVALEFGCGGSTQLFFEQGIKKLWSVDSDSAWLEKLMSNPEIRIAHKYGKWIPIHADIGEIQDWGNPRSKTPQFNWLNYHNACWNIISDSHFDIILIDGRFRVASLCQALLRCHNSDALFVIHDFWNREAYHIVLDFLTTQARANTLGIFTPKKDIDWKQLCLVLQEYQFIPE